MQDPSMLLQSDLELELNAGDDEMIDTWWQFDEFGP